MRLPDGSTLMHGDRPYDPKKAHEYYLRVRQLKGRRRGAGAQPSDGLRRSRADAAAQVARLQKKIGQLKQELRKRLSEEKKSEHDKHKKPTAADKHKKARESEKYRDKHKQELKTKAKQAASKNGGSSKKGGADKKGKGSVKELENTIKVLEQKLAAAVARKRALG